MKAPEKPIDNVTVTNLDAALRVCNIELSTALLDKVIDIVELIEDKGGYVTLKDLAQLQVSWKQLAALNSTER